MKYYQNKFIKINIFGLGLIIMCIKLIMQYTNRIFGNNEFIDSLLIFCALVLFILDFVFRSKYTLKQLINISCVGILCLYTCIQAKDYNLLITYFCLINCINYEFDYTVRVIHKTKVNLIFICAIIAILMTGFVGKNVLTMTEGGRIYFTLGFTHPNTIALVCFWCTMEYSYLNYRNKKHKRTEEKMLLLNVLFFALFGSKTALIGSLIWTLGMLLIRTKKISTKFLKYIAASIFPTAGIIFFALVYSYSNRGGALYKYSIAIDKIVTGRIKITARLYQIYGETILGQFVQRGIVQWDSYYQLNAVTIDGLFASFLVQVGLIYFILISVGIFKMVKSTDMVSQLTIIVYTYYALSEVGMLNGFLAFPLLMVGFYCLKNHRNSKTSYKPLAN